MKMKLRTGSTLALLMICLASHTTAKAETVLLTGVFTGTEASPPGHWEMPECNPTEMGYQQMRFEVSMDGEYQLRDLIYEEGVRVLPFISHWNDDLSLPEQFDWQASYETFNLEAGRAYSLIVIQNCSPKSGTWMIAASGPGVISSPAKAKLPAFSSGTFSPANPSMPTECGTLWGSWSWGVVGDAPYEQTGPIQVSRNGTYYYFNYISIQNSSPICLHIYTAPVDPTNPARNRVAMLDAWSTKTELVAGRDYYFVTQWNGQSGTSKYSDYLQALAPPAPFRINPGLTGRWSSTESMKDMYFLNVYDRLGWLFLAALGFDETAQSNGEYPRRWLTAGGKFVGTSAELGLQLTSGGAFNTSNPLPTTEQIGSMEIEFSDCSSGKIITRGLPDTAASSLVIEEVAIKRDFEDSLALCQSQYEGPGQPGPL